jgi:hypothetical protein
MALALSAIAFGAPVQAQPSSGEAQVKAAFVYSFLKFVEWPPGSLRDPDEPLVIALVGDSPTADATEAFLAAKRVRGHPVVLRRVAWDQPLAGVHAVFVAESDPGRLRRIFDATAAGAVLSIGEGEDFAARGGVIALVIEERKVRFDVDMHAARAASLKVSSKLLALTRIIHHDDGIEGQR